jgi:hypothetical protein
MASEFRTQERTLRVDPYRWKPLVYIIPQTLVVIVIGAVEVHLLLGVLAGYTADWVQAVIFGVLLAFAVVALGLSLRGWWHRPIGKTAIQQAAATVAQLMPGTAMVFRSPQRSSARPRKTAAFAVPAACLGLAMVGLLVGDMLIVWVSLGGAVVFGVVMAVLVFLVQEDAGRVLTVEPGRKTVVFEKFTFATTFFPNKPSRWEEIPFEGILDCTYYPGHKGGPATLRVRTLRGPTDIKEDIGGFETIRALLESLAILNLADPEKHQANLRKEPKVTVPWYGWLIFGGALLGLGILAWRLTKL